MRGCVFSHINRVEHREFTPGAKHELDSLTTKSPSYSVRMSPSAPRRHPKRPRRQSKACVAGRTHSLRAWPAFGYRAWHSWPAQEMRMSSRHLYTVVAHKRPVMVLCYNVETGEDEVLPLFNREIEAWLGSQLQTL